MAESGIYEIVNLVNGKRYVGSAVGIPKRWQYHRDDLNKRKHHNRHLQASWNKHGPDKFAFRVLEYCSPGHLIEREQHHMDLGCDYNIAPKAGSCLGVRHTAAARKRMSEARMGMTRTDESRRKQSLATKGIKKTPAQIAAQAAGTRRSFQNPERLKLHSEAIRKSYTEDLRLVRAEQSKARWADPAYRESMREKISISHDGDRRALTSRQAKERWADPEYRKQMSSKLSGREVTAEQRERLRQVNLGKRHSLETRRMRSALTDEQAEEVLHLRLAGKQHAEISHLTGISRTSVARICRRERYQWVAPHIPPLIETKHRRKELQYEPSLFPD